MTSVVARTRAADNKPLPNPTWTVFGVFVLDRAYPLVAVRGRRYSEFTDFELGSSAYPDGGWRLEVQATTGHGAMAFAKREVANDLNEALHRTHKKPYRMTEAAWKELQQLQTVQGDATLDDEDGPTGDDFARHIPHPSSCVCDDCIDEEQRQMEEMDEQFGGGTWATTRYGGSRFGSVTYGSYNAKKGWKKPVEVVTAISVPVPVEV